MKRLTLCAATLLLFCATVLHAQSILGTWQGTLPVPATPQNGGAGLRIVFTIERNPEGSLHGGITFIDRGTAVPLTSITFAAPDVTFVQGAAGVSVQGKLSSDGKFIAATWKQAEQSLPLNLELATANTLWTRQGPAALPPMAADADPSFEVATIKPTGPDENNTLFDLHARKFSAQHTSAKELIKIAYNLRGRQVIGGPPWLEETKFDVIAEPDTAGLPSEQQTRTMVRKLLVERFHLVCHTEQQLYPVMALTLDSRSPRPTPSDATYNLHGSAIGRRDGDDIVLQFSGTTIPQLLAFVMNTFQSKQLVDETGLTGIYDITLHVAGVAQGHMSDDDIGNALVQAAQQAGFKFISKKEPLPVVIVDHIDPPTPN